MKTQRLSQEGYVCFYYSCTLIEKKMLLLSDQPLTGFN